MSSDSPTQLDAWRRESAYVFLDVPQSPSPEQIAIRRYRRRNVHTLRPSWKDAVIGAYPDALSPLPPGDTSEADVTAIDIAADAEPVSYNLTTSRGQTIKLSVKEEALPAKRVFPFYSEVCSWDCLRAYWFTQRMDAYCTDPANRDDKLCWDPELPQLIKAIALARQFGIEPTKHSLILYDNPQTSEANVESLMKTQKYVQTVIEEATAPPLIWCGTKNEAGQSHDPNPYFLKKINDLAPPENAPEAQRWMAWCADEPTFEGNGIGMEVYKAIERVQYLRKHAPNLIPMITTGRANLKHLQALANGLPILYCIVQNEDNPTLLSQTKGSYFSCMAQGNCRDTDNPFDRTAFPVAVIEGDPHADFEGAIRLAYTNKARFALYYKITKRLTTCWQPGGLYNEGGNGDGTALYVDESTGDPLPSMRMLHWHRGQQAVEKMILQPEGPH